MYFYPKGVAAYAREVKPSPRGKLEITDLNLMYLIEDKLDVVTLGRGVSWLDITGTHEAMADATAFVRMVEEHEGLIISCPEEIAYINGWISKEEMVEEAKAMKKSRYGQYLIKVANGEIKY